MQARISIAVRLCETEKHASSFRAQAGVDGNEYQGTSSEIKQGQAFACCETFGLPTHSSSQCKAAGGAGSRITHETPALSPGVR